MNSLKFKKQWNDFEETKQKILNIFSDWQKENLEVTYGRLARTVRDTYGFPYTSSSGFAMISNVNVIARLKGNPYYFFKWLAITETGDVVVGCMNNVGEQKRIIIGKLR